MLSRQCKLTVVILLATVVTTWAVSCPVSTCDSTDPLLPVTWMNTSSMAARVHGLSFTLFPMKRNGQYFEGAFLHLSFTGLQELQPKTDIGECDVDTAFPDESEAASTVLRELIWSELCCDVSFSWEIIGENVNRTSATITATDPSHPEMVFKLLFHLVNDSIDFPQPATPENGVPEYNISYSSISTKMNLEISDWPWVGATLPTNKSNPSYLKFFFLATSQLEEMGNMTVSYNPWLASCRSFTNRSLVALDLLKIFTADGVDYLFRSATSSKDFSYILQTLTLPMVVPICRSKFIMDQPYWRNFTYDPTLTALYDDPEIHNPITNPSKPNNKNRLNPAAYAVPIAIVALALGAVAVALFTPLRQVFTKKTKTIPAKDFSDLTKNTIHESRNAPPATEPTKSANTWVRSSKVDH